MEKDFEPFDWMRIVVGERPPLYVLDGEISVFLNDRKPAVEDLIIRIAEASRGTKTQRPAWMPP